MKLSKRERLRRRRISAGLRRYWRRLKSRRRRIAAAMRRYWRRVKYAAARYHVSIDRARRAYSAVARGMTWRDALEVSPPAAWTIEEWLQAHPDWISDPMSDKPLCREWRSRAPDWRDPDPAHGASYEDVAAVFERPLPTVPGSGTCIIVAHTWTIRHVTVRGRRVTVLTDPLPITLGSGESLETAVRRAVLTIRDMADAVEIEEASRELLFVSLGIIRYKKARKDRNEYP